MVITQPAIAGVAGAVAVGVSLVKVGDNGQLSAASSTVSLSSSGSQASPCASLSAFAWFVFAAWGQLSAPSATPSLSSSPSQGLPRPSLSLSVWSALEVSGQLSQALPVLSLSVFSWPGFCVTGQLSLESGSPSPSESAVKIAVTHWANSEVLPPGSVAVAEID